jgi:hypothetical protein
MIGIMIAQLYRLQHRSDPDDVFGYFVLSKPLSVILQSAALAVSLLGGFRFWRQQSAMAVGRVHAGGWEFIGTGVLALVVSYCFQDGPANLMQDRDTDIAQLLIGLFIIHIAIDVYKEAENEP